MQEYVAGFMFDDCGHVALVRKNKPEWQRGFLNGIGGRVEPGETPLTAMRREWTEETGNVYRDWIHFVSISGASSTVHFFIARVGEMPFILPVNDIGEKNLFVKVDKIEQRYDIVPNLRWLIPLALDCSGFRIIMPNSTEIYGAIPAQHGLPMEQSR